MRFLGRLALGLALGLAAIEFGLRWTSYGHPTTLFVPGAVPGWLEPNPNFTTRFYGGRTVARPLFGTFRRTKPPGATRIFLIGDSAARGLTDSTAGLARQLGVVLGQRQAGRSIEVIDTSMRGVDSYVGAAAAWECAELSPDVLVVYLGNHELLGAHGCDLREGAWGHARWWRRMVHWARGTRLGVWWNRGRGRVTLGDVGHFLDLGLVGADRIPPRDWRRARVREGFLANVESICRAARSAGARVVLCTVPVNLEEFPPLGTWEAPGRSLASGVTWATIERELEAAVREADHARALALLDLAVDHRPDDATLHFRRGQMFRALGRGREALEMFAEARDRDSRPVRVDRPMNAMVREVGQRRADLGVVVLDLEQEFYDRAIRPAAGRPVASLFRDHVHLTFDGEGVVARRMASAVEGVLGWPPGGRSGVDGPTPESVRAGLPFTLLDEAALQQATWQLFQLAPFRGQFGHWLRQSRIERELRQTQARWRPGDGEAVVRTYQQVLRGRPHDGVVRARLGELLLQLGRAREAATEFDELCRRYPGWVPFRLGLVAALAAAGDRPGAAEQRRAAASMDSGDPLLPR